VTDTGGAWLLPLSWFVEASVWSFSCSRVVDGDSETVLYHIFASPQVELDELDGGVVGLGSLDPAIRVDLGCSS